MRIKPLSKQRGAVRWIGFALGLLLLLAGFSGLIWSLWANRSAVLETDIPAVRVPLSWDEQDCELLIPAGRMRLTWPERIGLGRSGKVAVSYLPDADLEWECAQPLPEGSSIPDVFLELRLEIPESLVEPALSLQQKFLPVSKKSFGWSVHFPQRTGVFTATIRMKTLIRFAEASTNSAVPVENLDDWLLATREMPVSVVSVLELPAGMILAASIGCLLVGLFGLLFLPIIYH